MRSKPDPGASGWVDAPARLLLRLERIHHQAQALVLNAKQQAPTACGVLASCYSVKLKTVCRLMPRRYDELARRDTGRLAVLSQH
ncbi:MAG TPA: hypothetical protein VI197_20390 [Polyangiaceae bacterium]